MGRARWFGALIFAATLLVYAQAARHDFVNWDDPEFVVQNVAVSHGITLTGLTWALTHGQGGTWHPVTSLSHMLDCELFGLWPGGHHLMSAVLHATAAVLLLGLLSAMTGAPGPSAFVAGVFALHPLRVESVAWVSERKDVLAAVFWMMALWAYCDWIRRPSVRRYHLLLGVFALGLLAKPMVVTLPLVLLLLDVWPLERPVPFRRRVFEKLPLFALAAVMTVVTFIVQQRSGAVASLEKIGLADRAANALVAYGWYAVKTLWPSGLAFFYPLHLPIPAWQIAASGVFFAGATALGWLTRRSRPWLLVGWLWYVVMLVPVIGLVRVGDQAVADRYTYLPGIGLSMMAAWSAVDLVRGWPQLRAAVAATAIAALLVLAAASWHQVGYWRNNLTLYERALALTPDNYVAHTNLGTALLQQDHVAEAFSHFQEALRLRPDAPEAHSNLALVLAARGERDAAVAAYKRALELDPRDVGAHVHFADLLVAGGELGEAIAHYRAAVELRPDSAEVHNNLGYLLAAQGGLVEAVDHYRAALRTDPGLAAAHTNLALALEQLQQRDEALSHYAAAVKLTPADPRAHVNYAAGLARAARHDDAVAELREALRYQPGWQPAEQELAALLVTDADPARRAEGVALAERFARSAQPATPEVLSTLAVGYEGVGRLADALAAWDEAIAAARSTGRADLVPSFEAAAAKCRARVTREPY